MYGLFYKEKMNKYSILLLCAMSFTLCINTHPFAATLQEQLAKKIDYVVAADGSGDYKTVQAAINAVPDSSTTRKVIFIKNGTYNEKIVIPYKKTNLTIVGANVDSCIITYNDVSKDTYSKNTYNTYTLRVDPDDFIAMNLTIKNTATSAQAVALHASGDRQVYLHCRICGYQDTYFSNLRTRNYLKDCFIEGATDYTFGWGINLFDSCQINSIKAKGYICAAATSDNYRFGYVFRNCKLTNTSSATNYYLGRPWFSHAHTVFYICEENSSLNTAGWAAWDNTSKREDTCYYREYKCFGAGSATTSRATFGKQLTDAESKIYELDTIFSKNSYPQGATSDTAEINAILRRFLVSTTDSMEQIAQDFMKCGRDTYPSFPTTDWQPRVDTDAVYKIVKANTIKFMDSGKVITLIEEKENGFVCNNGVTVRATSDNHIKINLTAEHQAAVTLRIYDVLGKSVLVKKFSPISQGINNLVCDAKALKQGIYFYRIAMNGKTFSGKFEKL
jgi:pectinesterase